MNEIKLTMNFIDGVFTLNEGTIAALGKPKQIQLLINVDKKMLLLRACSTDDLEAVVIPEQNVLSTDIAARVLLGKLREKMNWITENPRECPGVYYAGYNAVGFDLSQVHEIVS